MPSCNWGVPLSPLQSKFAASLVATTLLVVILFFVAYPRSAYSYSDFEFGFDSFGGEAGVFRRENEIVRGLGNSVPGSYNLEFGQINYWVLEPSQLFIDDDDSISSKKRGEGPVGELRKRQGGADSGGEERSRTVYLTFNTCLQPQRNDTGETAGSGDNDGDVPKLPQLAVYLSNSSSNQAPGPGVLDRPQISIPVMLGYANFTFNTSGSIWVGVYAPDVEDRTRWGGIWNYELVLSTRKQYHGYIEDQFLYLVDSDNEAALLITGNMTTGSAADGGVDEDVGGDELMGRPPPYLMYAQNRGVRSRFQGLEKSYCAVTKLAQVRPGSLDVSMTRRGLGNLPKQQFHLRELNRSSSYFGYLARPNSTNPSDTSGTLWRAMRINTKKDGNCQIIYNLPFCSEVAYAVPSNPTLFNMDNLTNFYDDIAKSWHKNFSYSLQQIQCNASSSAQYSLARSCADCDAAYKNWLCAVTIPRCMDFSSKLPYLAKRAVGEMFYNASSRKNQTHPFNITDIPLPLDGANTTHTKSSRNTKIDQIIRPGPYKEVKPCMDLCWTLVQSCPSSLGFQCPGSGSWGMMQSYGARDLKGDVTCSFLGAVYFLSSAEKRWNWISGGAGWIWALGMAAWFAWTGL
ncbi:stretch-activated Ca2+-permeable channel component-domain-containing protein [Tuber brumale]|nr:stretch-activated Ca2+-permeable channel component-domain-containing protein [Tuber brumale]